MDTELFNRIRSYAEGYLRRGISLLPMCWDRKKPALSWKAYMTRLPTLEEVGKQWEADIRNLDATKVDEEGPRFNEGYNLGIVTGRLSRLAVIDCESVTNAQWFLGKYNVDTPLKVRTKRGVHLYYRHPEDWEVRNTTHVKCEEGISRYDVRGEGGYVVAPPSYFGGHQYHFLGLMVDFEKLPVFRQEWRPETMPSIRKQFTDGIAYISKIMAVSGSNGHHDTYRAVCVLREAGLDETECMAAITEWNATNAQPPWTVRELLHKVRDAYSKP